MAAIAKMSPRTAVDLNGSRILSDSSMYMIATTHPTLTVDVSNELTRKDVESRINAYLGGAGIVKFAFHLAMCGFDSEPEKPKLVAVGGNRCVFSTAPEELRGARVLLTCVRFTATGPVNLVANVVRKNFPSHSSPLPRIRAFPEEGKKQAAKKFVEKHRKYGQGFLRNRLYCRLSGAWGRRSP